MSVVLYFPTKAAPTHTVTLPDPFLPYAGGVPHKYDAITQTDSGVRYIYDKGITDTLFTMMFRIVNASDYLNLIDFWKNSANGMVNTFEFDDPDNNLVTGAMFATTSLQGKAAKVTNSMYEVTLDIIA